MTLRSICSLISALLLAGCTCNSNVNYTIYSGSAQDNDVEEPLSSRAQKFKPMLDESNELVSLLQQNRLQEVYDHYFDDSLKKQLSFERFQKLYASIVSRVGPVATFKPLQWEFRVLHGLKGKLVSSYKIVHHARGIMEYEFTFASETSNRLIGISIRSRKPRGNGADAGASH